MTLDGLRAPSRLDGEAQLYKDWLHLNLFDRSSGLVGLVNVALHGHPDDPRARAVGTALVHLPDGGWAGNVESIGLHDAAVEENAVGLRAVALGLDRPGGRVLASVRLPQDGLELDVAAAVAGRPLAARWQMPRAHGWISWIAVAHLAVGGTVTARGRSLSLEGADAYHDHQWGRWRWGDDLGWKWGCFMAPGGDPTFVVVRTFDRSHRHGDRASVIVHAGARRRIFAGDSVRIEVAGELDAAPRRVPGALAALHSDRARPRLPAEVRVDADDGAGHVSLAFRPRACAQIIAAELTQSGYGFIHELPGSFEASGRVNGTDLTASGLGIFEHVD
jgi:hypothetical protein